MCRIRQLEPLSHFFCDSFLQPFCRRTGYVQIYPVIENLEEYIGGKCNSCDLEEGFKLTNPTHENTEISYIKVDIHSELYMDEKIFSDCSRLKDIIYDYAREHPDNFSLIPASDQDIDENMFSAKGIHVNFTDASVGKSYGGSRIVFEFTN